MGIECVAKTLAFYKGRRIRPGKKFMWEGDENKLPSWALKATESVVLDKVADPAKVKKANSISDVPIEGRGSKKVLKASPAAIQLAEEYTVDMEDVVATGADGQITKGDVQAFIDANTGNEVI